MTQQDKNNIIQDALEGRPKKEAKYVPYKDLTEEEQKRLMKSRQESQNKNDQN